MRIWLSHECHSGGICVALKSCFDVVVNALLSRVTEECCDLLEQSQPSGGDLYTAVKQFHWENPNQLTRDFFLSIPILKITISEPRPQLSLILIPS